MPKLPTISLLADYRWRTAAAIGLLHIALLLAVLGARHGTQPGLRDNSTSIHWLSAITLPAPVKPPGRWAPLALALADSAIASPQVQESPDPGNARTPPREQTPELPAAAIVDADPLAGAASAAAAPEPGGAVLDMPAFQRLQALLAEVAARRDGARAPVLPRVSIAAGIDGSPRAAMIETSSGDAEFDETVVAQIIAFGPLLRPEPGRDRVIPKTYLLPALDTVPAAANAA